MVWTSSSILAELQSRAEQASKEGGREGREGRAIKGRKKTKDTTRQGFVPGKRERMRVKLPQQCQSWVVMARAHDRQKRRRDWTDDAQLGEPQSGTATMDGKRPNGTTKETKQ